MAGGATRLCYNLPAMPLTIEEVRHIANLARLRLTSEEEARYRGQLSAILDYAARLAEIDTSSIPPTATVIPLQAPLRADEPRHGLSQSRILSNAPATEQGMFRIPPVFEGGA
jgi:aspartyl-tRNA(Asn)/glutamyl-tRNA(Gln) amidotransferase subunit C